MSIFFGSDNEVNWVHRLTGISKLWAIIDCTHDSSSSLSVTYCEGLQWLSLPQCSDYGQDMKNFCTGITGDSHNARLTTSDLWQWVLLYIQHPRAIFFYLHNQMSGIAYRSWHCQDTIDPTGTRLSRHSSTGAMENNTSMPNITILFLTNLASSWVSTYLKFGSEDIRVIFCTNFHHH